MKLHSFLIPLQGLAAEQHDYLLSWAQWEAKPSCKFRHLSFITSAASLRQIPARVCPCEADRPVKSGRKTEISHGTEHMWPFHSRQLIKKKPSHARLSLVFHCDSTNQFSRISQGRSHAGTKGADRSDLSVMTCRRSAEVLKYECRCSLFHIHAG